MHYYEATEYRPGPMVRIRQAITGIRDWLDEKGKLAWIGAMVLGFIFVWPVGLAILIYMIGSNRMFGCTHRHGHSSGRVAFQSSTGNAAFDAYRAETLKRLEAEHNDFMAFMVRLQEARDKAEFVQFMSERHNRATGRDQNSE
ncbi:MAG: DUF2852 domain-containing protein [Paracoccus sp. (in: a-proteobacteria)]